jgi:hypothetical protein
MAEEVRPDKKAKNTEHELAKWRQLYWKKVMKAELKKRPFETVVKVTNPIPEALYHPNGDMRKPVKSDYNKFLVEKVFPDCLSNQYPRTEAWVMDGMFMIQSTPLAICKDVEDHVRQTVKRWILPKLAGKCYTLDACLY